MIYPYVAQDIRVYCVYTRARHRPTRARSDCCTPAQTARRQSVRSSACEASRRNVRGPAACYVLARAGIVSGSKPHTRSRRPANPTRPDGMGAVAVTSADRRSRRRHESNAHARAHAPRPVATTPSPVKQPSAASTIYTIVFSFLP